MTLNEYQKKTSETAKCPRVFIERTGESDQYDFALEAAPLYEVLGLAGEVGEVLELIKKSCRVGQELDIEKLKLELGDVLWYLAQLAFRSRITLEDVAQSNLDKLKARYGAVK